MGGWRSASCFIVSLFASSVYTQSTAPTTTAPSASTETSATPTPMPDGCPGGTGKYIVANNTQAYVLVCSVDYPGNDIVQYNAFSINECVETCESVNSVYPESPCVGITYQPTLDFGNTCHVKSRFANQQSQDYQVDAAIRVDGFTRPPATSTTTATTSAASSTTAATANDGCPETNGTTLTTISQETYTLLCGVVFPSNRIGDSSGVDMQGCVQQCSYINTAVGNRTCVGVTYESGTCYPLGQANSGDSVASPGNDSAILDFVPPPEVSSSTSATSTTSPSSISTGSVETSTTEPSSTSIPSDSASSDIAT